MSADQPELEIRHAGARDIHQGHAWIGRQARLHVVGLGDSQIVVGGLQVAVVEKRHLHRVVGGQRPGQQVGDLLLRPLGLLGAGDLDDVLADVGSGFPATP